VQLLDLGKWPYPSRGFHNASAPSIVPTNDASTTQPHRRNSGMSAGVVHGAFGFDRGAVFFFYLFATLLYGGRQ
jgi:hypothetical protein